MPAYQFCVALRHLDGTLDPPVRVESIVAESSADAIDAAKRIDVDMVGTWTNSVYLTDPAGYVVWSMRLGEVWRDQAG